MPCTHPTRIPKIGLVAEFIQAPVKIRTMRVEEQSFCFCNDSNISFQSMYKRKQSSINECIEGFNPRMYYEIGPRKSTLFFHGQGFVTAGRCSDVSKAVPIPLDPELRLRHERICVVMRNSSKCMIPFLPQHA